MGLSSSSQVISKDSDQESVSPPQIIKRASTLDVSPIKGGWGTVAKIMDSLEAKEEKSRGYMNLDTGRWITSEQTISSKKFRNEIFRCVSDKKETIELIEKIMGKYKDNREKMPKKKQRTPLSPKIRDEVWMKYCGDHILSKCYVCEREISYMQGRWECGHVISYATGGEDKVENLRPICFTCNRGMGTSHMKEYCINNNYKIHPTIK